MRNTIHFNIKDFDTFRKQLTGWASAFENFCILDSNSDKNEELRNNKYSSYDLLAGVGTVKIFKPEKGSFERFKNYSENVKDWKFGHLAFDLKMETENVPSSNPDVIGFPDFFFFQPIWVVLLKGNDGEFLYPEFITSEEAQHQFEILKNAATNVFFQNSKKELVCRVGKKEYLKNVTQLKGFIARGDIYEINYCIDYFASNYELEPYSTWLTLNSFSPNPFSAFYKQNDKFLLCTSPERFLKNDQSKLISQPIKGTAKRGKNEIEDLQLKKGLQDDMKERAENTMIADLVRNDLARTAKPGSVKVEEFCEVYTFRHVHQMISTITAELDEGINYVDAIKNAFPMGSMTGAPKNSALKLIEKFENIKRGLFSGSVGYIDPENNFDFNVVIRSVLYNQTNKNISVPIGSAITTCSKPENEFEECMLKARPLLEVLRMQSGK
jgi:para-aminobenzoate synthetase component 1